MPRTPSPEPEELLRELEFLPEPPLVAPPWPADEEQESAEVMPFPAQARRRRRWHWAGGVMAAAAALLLAVLFAQPERGGEGEPLPPWREGLRGEEAAAGLEVNLRLALEEEGEARRVARNETVQVGQRVFFRVDASPPSEVTVWVVAPGGVETVAAVKATEEPIDLQGEQGLIAYRFEQPGLYVFHAAADVSQECVAPACFQHPLNVR